MIAYAAGEAQASITDVLFFNILSFPNIRVFADYGVKNPGRERVRMTGPAAYNTDFLFLIRLNKKKGGGGGM